MNSRLISRKAKIIEIFFLIVISSLIAVSCFLPLNAGGGQIGIKARPLEIGDRKFYINDAKPFSGNGYGEFKGGPLYPKILESISFTSIKIFKQNTISDIWNIQVISISSILSFFTLRLIYYSGKILKNEETGVIAMAIYAALPYTYFYALSGGITSYTLFGTSACTYLVLKIQRELKTEKLKDMTILLRILLSIFLLYTSLLRPSSIIFSLVATVFLIIKEIHNYRYLNKNHKMLFINILIYSVPLGICIHQFWETQFYTRVAIDSFASERGTFFGYSRDLLREKIGTMRGNAEIFEKAKSILLQIMWKFNDFFTGINDLRDTHSPTSNSLFSFLIRVTIGTFILAPVSYISLLGIFIYKKLILKTNLWICLIASTLAISPSLIGVAMSRYYFMFITPFILIASVMFSEMYFQKTLRRIE